VYFDDRTDARTYLADHGWQTTTTSTTDLLAQHGLPPIDAEDAPFGEVLYVSAELIGA
jgi:O-methyltransferase involved in polyketide biosynthesis